MKTPETLAEIPYALREGLCFHEAFQRLGFQSKDIYVDIAPIDNPPPRSFVQGPRKGEPIPEDCICMIVQLQTQGRTFTMDYPDDSEFTKEQLRELWPMALKLWNQSSKSALDAVWNKSWTVGQITGLITSLLFKGFALPSNDVMFKSVASEDYLTITPEA